MGSDMIARAAAVVEHWLHQPGNLARLDLEVIYVPDLSTPSFSFFVIAQRGVAHANRRYVVSDGEQVPREGGANVHRDRET